MPSDPTIRNSTITSNQVSRCACSNDAFDSVTGADSEDRKPESIINLTGAPWLNVLAAAFALLAWGASKLYATLTAAGSPVAVCLLAGSILCGYMYQGPPFRCCPPSLPPISLDQSNRSLEDAHDRLTCRGG